jgi:hypothetical protein
MPDSGLSENRKPDFHHSEPMAAQAEALPRILRPIVAYALHGLAPWGEGLLAIDQVRGYLLQVNLEDDNTQILNGQQSQAWQGATGLALTPGHLWFTQDRQVYSCPISKDGAGDFTPRPFVTLPYPADGVAVWETTVYVTCQKAGHIFLYDRQSRRKIDQFPLPGVGIANITAQEQDLWLCDRTEQTVYCLDRVTGNLQLSVLSPFESPTGLAFVGDQLYVAYAGEEAYIRDNPNADPSHELTYRDRTFIHAIDLHCEPAEHYALSNGYLLEMSYVEELLPLADPHADSPELVNLEWRMALPAQSDRQKVLQVTPIGMPFTEELVAGQRVALFRFANLPAHQRGIFGWKAKLAVRGIKYQISFAQVEDAPQLAPELQARYLVDDDELAMDQPIIQQAAREAIGTETNVLRQMLKIRNYVYDRLSYGIQPRIDTPDVVLKRGVGSCGEYVGVLLALARLNGIACRTVGRYKCPPFADRLNVPLVPDFNHVWIEFYLPGVGWLPMESNPDDVVERGPYPTRFFMGLPWSHVEMGKGIAFESVKSNGMPLRELGDRSIGDLALNHVRFRILRELGAGEWPASEKTDAP